MFVRDRFNASEKVGDGTVCVKCQLKENKDDKEEKVEGARCLEDFRSHKKVISLRSVITLKK